MPLVLVHNDVVANPEHMWNDVEGVQYHYPSKYQSRIKTGEPFVYYRGVHRAHGRRGQAEYVGTGLIGAIWPDPNPQGKRRKAWYCAIEDYRRFETPIPAKNDNEPLEQIPRNLWRDGVRVLDPTVFRRILNLELNTGQAQIGAAQTAIGNLTQSDNLIVPAPLLGPRGSTSRSTSYRKSKRAKEIGNWAELMVLRYIQERVTGCTTCIHRAAIDETPGWDIDYVDPEGSLQRVEVKGTVAAAFTGVDMTRNELMAAQAHGANYWLYLVAGCLTDSAKVQAIQDPATRLSAGEWSAVPTLFSLQFAPST